MAELFVLGGSPCSGKSTIAARIAEKYGFRSYQLDEDADAFIAAAGAAGAGCAARVLQYSPDQLWGRPPYQQMADEITLYREIAGLIEDKIRSLGPGAPVIAEGAGFLPDTASLLGLDAGHYFCMVPQRTFQYTYYARRQWVPDVLKGCTDPQRAFENWMERDCLFAEKIARQAQTLGYGVLQVDGSLTLAQTLALVEAVFALSRFTPLRG